MEIFLIYDSLYSTFATMLPISLTDAHFLALVIGGGVWLTLFILQGFGLWKMAKNRGFKNKALAFIPFANYLYIGKLAGEVRIFGQKIKRIGLFMMFAQIFATLFCACLAFSLSYLLIVEGAPLDNEGMMYWGGSGFSAVAENFYGYGSMLFVLLVLVYKIFAFVLALALYKKYAPRPHIWLALLSVFVPEARYIIIFCLRRKKAIDYEAYMRARQEEIVREYQKRYGGQYGSPFGGPFGGPYGGQYGNPYGNPYGNNTPYGQNPTQEQKAPEDPFEEFGKGESQGEKKDGDDDFFA